MRTYFSIGEVSKMTGLTINALRHYDKIGLCRPIVVNQETNYRYYDQSQLFIFDIINFAKKIDLPLEELSKILNSNDMATFKDFLDALKKRMSSQIESLTMTMLDLDSIQEKIVNGEYLVKTKDLYQRDISERDIISSPVLPESVNNRYVKQRERMELQIRKNKLNTTFETGTIYRFADQKLEEAAIYKGIVLNYDTDSGIISRIPAGSYLCIAYTEAKRKEAWERFIYGITDLRLKDPLILEVLLLNDIYDKGQRAYELETYLGEATDTQ